MPKSSQRQITILPHIGVDREIDLQDYVLFSSKNLLDWIPKSYRRNVSALTSLFKTIDFDIDNVGLIVRKRAKNRLGTLADDELDQLSRVVDALAFSAHGRRRYRAVMRDNFEFAIWNFEGKKAPPKMINLRNRRYGMHVVERKDHMLQVPLHVHFQTISQNTIDNELLKALLLCALSDREEDIRIMRAINWVNQSRTDTGSVTDYNRFLLIATAFEALLNTPESGIRRYFMKTTQFLLGSSSELNEWSDQFYRLRSKIVHGEGLPELGYGADKHSSILTLADIVFCQCLIRKLGLMNYWSDHVAEHVRREDVRKYLISNKKRFAAFQKFNLNSKLEWSLTVFNHLHTIQRGDPSASAADCKKTLIALLDLSLQGVRRLNHMRRLRGKSYQGQLQKYRTAFTTVLNRINDDQNSEIHREFMAITPDATDEWADATVRGLGFGNAGVIDLGALIHAIREVDDLYTMARYS